MLKGKNIPLGARIIAVADAYDAMTSNRSYRKALTTQEACEELIKCSGTQFDPEIVQIFLTILYREGKVSKVESSRECLNDYWEKAYIINSSNFGSCMWRIGFL